MTELSRLAMESLKMCARLESVQQSLTDAMESRANRKNAAGSPGGVEVKGSLAVRQAARPAGVWDFSRTGSRFAQEPVCVSCCPMMAGD